MASSNHDPTRVLITGGSGYLGQFLINALKNDYEVAYTYLINAIVDHPVNAEPFKADLATGEGVPAAVLSFKPHVVVNCAAISQPAACERDYEACKNINVPSKLVEALGQLHRREKIEALLIQISTDQVYDGRKSSWSETCPTHPVNAYGRSKLEAEQYILEHWTGRSVVLRASLIVGPEPPLQRVGRPLFVQFVESVLARGQETTFFVDEYRSAVWVHDICKVVQHIISRYTSSSSAAAAADAPGSATPPPPPAAAGEACCLAHLPHSIYNMGGPQRLSRLDMAMAVAQRCGHSSKAIKPCNSADVHRGYNSPADISMNMERLLTDMPGIELTTFAACLAEIFPHS